MPTIGVINGIVIIMHLTNKEHNPPHIHAIYGEYEATFYIKNRQLFEELFPKAECKIIHKFINKYSIELLEMWETGIYRKLSALI